MKFKTVIMGNGHIAVFKHFNQHVVSIWERILYFVVSSSSVSRKFNEWNYEWDNSFLGFC